MGIAFTDSPILSVFILLQPSNIGYEEDPIVVQFSALKFTVVKPVQPEKAPLPIEVTLLGMVTSVKPVQPEKAELPIEVTLLGMVTSVKLVQYQNA